MITLAQIKAVLGITVTTYDTRLQEILDGVNSYISQKIGDYTQGTKTEKHDKYLALQSGKLFLGVNKITAVNSIGGVAIDSSKYEILKDNSVYISDTSIIPTDKQEFSVEYVAGYTTIPESLISSVAYEVGRQFSSDMGKDVAKESLGPRSVEYIQGAEGDVVQKRLQMQIRELIPLCLKVW